MGTIADAKMRGESGTFMGREKLFLKRGRLIPGNETAGLLLALLASFSYGLMPALTQRAYLAGASVETVLTARYLTGTGMIWLYILVKRKKTRIGRANACYLAAVGIIIFICVFCVTSSYKSLPGAVAALIVFSYIIIVNIVEMLTGKTRPYPALIFCLVLTMAGLGAVVYTPSAGASLNPQGLILALIGGSLYAIWTMAMGAKRLASFSAEAVMGYMLIVPTLANVVKCLLAGEPLLPRTNDQWINILLLALSPGFISPVAFCAAVKRVGAGTASIMNASEPLIAYFAGILLMGDKLSVNATIGGTFIITGILLLNISRRRRDRLAPKP